MAKKSGHLARKEVLTLELILFIGLILASACVGYIACKIRDSSLCFGTLHIVPDENEKNRTNLYLELKVNPRTLERRDFVMLKVRNRK